MKGVIIKAQTWFPTKVLYCILEICAFRLVKIVAVFFTIVPVCFKDK